MFAKCRHIKTDGNECKSPALRNQAFCYYHTRLRRTVKADNSASDQSLQLPVLEDNSAIQLALTQVLSALGASRIDPQRAGLYLRGLQIAMKNLDRESPADLIETVKIVAHTDDDGDLAPDAPVCDRAEDCASCRHKDSCRNYDSEEQHESPICTGH
jgi:hypothetical protein